MAHAGQEIEGPSGYRLVLEQVGPECLVMEAVHAGPGPLPPVHLHPTQTERFEVLEGSLLTIVGGVQRTYLPGETLEIAPGVAHQMAALGPTRMRWEVRPALRTAEFFERLFGDGPDSAREADSIAGFLAEFADEIRFAE